MFTETISKKTTKNLALLGKSGLLESTSSNLVHIKKSLVYFTDADQEAMPKMIISVSWSEVKNFFKKEIQKIEAE